MQTARRLYVYILSGIGLGGLVGGVSMLLTVLFGRVGLGPQGDAIFGADEAIRQQLTLASAITAVSLPVWLIHWFAAERSVRPDRVTASVERAAGVRGLYFALALGGLLLASAIGAASALEGAILRLLGASDFGYRDIGGGLALALVAGAAWGYLVRIRIRDWGRGAMTGAGAWLPRTYLYAATFAGLMLLLSGVIGLIELIGRILINEPSFVVSPDSGPWWAFPLATAVSAAAVGGAIFLGHAGYADRLRRDIGARGASERQARLRLAYYVAVIAVGAAAAVYLLAEGIGNALAAALGVSDETGTGQTVGLIVVPILNSIPYAIVWWIHARWMVQESAALDSAERIETASRLELYPVALVALGYAAVALAWLIGLLIEVTVGAGQVIAGGDSWRRELAQFVPLAGIGGALWILRWRDVNARSAVDPAGEAASTTRRTMLLIVVAVSILAVIGSGGVILYRLFGTIFGATLGGNAVLELSGPIGALLVAGAVALFHGVVLRRDQALRTGMDAALREEAAPVAGATLTLRLSGPPDEDMEAVVAKLRAELPPGYGLEATGA